jgi:hemolysin activation/secretion protein
VVPVSVGGETGSTAAATASAVAAALPGAEGADAEGAEGGRKEVLDEYLLRLDRFAGRRVDVANAGTNKTSELNLDYLVSEHRPWYAFAQVSNTGTSQTGNLRERFGYVNNQLSGRDDLLTLDHMTANFSQSHAIWATYSKPFLDSNQIRMRVLGSWLEYTASDVGQNAAEFTGESWSAGGELVANIFQHRELFLYAVAGAKVQESQTQNAEAGADGFGLFVVPYAGVRLERVTDLATSVGGVTLMGYLSGTDEAKLAGLGRADPARNPMVLQWDFSQSVYLEPLLDAQEFAAGRSTLAHEVYGAVRGQYAFGSRLVPEAQDAAGGMFSVRGYPESVAAGDTVVVGTVEYRFHVPRVWPVQGDPTRTPFLWARSFRWMPERAYGRPDWDLMLRAFVDAAQVNPSQRQAFEQNATLVGTGVGMELQVMQNVNVRVDWGVALTDVPGEVRAGEGRVHVSVTGGY